MPHKRTFVIELGLRSGRKPEVSHALQRFFVIDLVRPGRPAANVLGELGGAANHGVASPARA